MNLVSIQALATTFTVGSAILGTPSIVALVVWTVHAIRTRLAPAAQPGSSFSDNPDAIQLILKGMVATVSALGRVAGALEQMILNGLAVASVVGVVLAMACWFTGRGLQQQAEWARLSATILLGIPLLLSLLLALSVHNVARLLMLAIVTLCAFGLHTLWIGYATATR